MWRKGANAGSVHAGQTTIDVGGFGHQCQGRILVYDLHGQYDGNSFSEHAEKIDEVSKKNVSFGTG